MNFFDFTEDESDDERDVGDIQVTDMLVFGEPADEETERRRKLESVMRALYLRYVVEREKPEEVLDGVFVGWRNLASWHKNSCHIDVILDVALWSFAWLGSYEHVRDTYKRYINTYINERIKGHVKEAQDMCDVICTLNLNKSIGGFHGARFHIICMTEPQYHLNASLSGNVLSAKVVNHEKPLYVVEIEDSQPEVVFHQTYVMKDRENNSFEYVPLAAIIGVPGHFRSALNVTAMAKKLAPGRMIDGGPPVWYGFDHYADKKKTEAIPRITKLEPGEKLIGLLLVKR